MKVACLLIACLGLGTAGCSATRNIDLGSSRAPAQIAHLNRHASAGRVNIRSSETGAGHAPQWFAFKTFEIGTDSALFVLRRGQTLHTDLAHVNVIRLPRRGRGAAIGAIGGTLIGAGTGVFLAVLVAWMEALGGDGLSAQTGLTIIGTSVAMGAGAGAALGGLAGAPIRYRFIGKDPGRRR